VQAGALIASGTRLVIAPGLGRLRFMSSAMEDTLEAEGVPERQLKKTKKRPVA
jgi:hypothetical protein